MISNLSFECTLPISQYPMITMAHGGGGALTKNLIDYLFRPAFNSTFLEQQHDSARIQLSSNTIAVTTDSFVVRPIFFPGGDIGALSLIGTMNDLAMRGATPMYVTCAFILSEGLPIETLIRIVDSMRLCALEHAIQIVAGDIKVIEKQNEPSVFINTTGIGVLPQDLDISPASIRENDFIIVSNDIGRHGLAVLSAREQLDFEPVIHSDTAALWPLVSALLAQKVEIHCMRDLTRGGLGAALIEISQASESVIEIDENCLPICTEVQAGCELLGLDPTFVANEGCMILFVPKSFVEQTLEILQGFEEGRMACEIGRVVSFSPGSSEVIMNNPYGGQRTLHLLTGEQLPRIC